MLKVVELFAGVGGFRLGFERVDKNYFKTVWANQWEPSRSKQHAADCYAMRFGNENKLICEDIAKVKHLVPTHDLLCGGFPCQDYSVANSNAKGIKGEKGVLWWEIRDIVEAKKPKLVFLENVDRLIKSPAKQRGRDFGIILRCLDDLGYAVEWKVINAADYGHPQKRRRILIMAYRKNSQYFDVIKNKKFEDIIEQKGILAKAFKNKIHTTSTFSIGKERYKTLVSLSQKFKTQFFNSGYMCDGVVTTATYEPIYKGKKVLLKDILDKKVDSNCYVNSKDLRKWKYLKGSKNELRKKPNGEMYRYTEGALCFPDNLNCQARTMLTSEGSINRSSHVILDPITKKLRILTPEECEKINEFPAGWTNTGMPQRFRYFIMGNALVVGLFESVSKAIKNFLK